MSAFGARTGRGFKGGQGGCLRTEMSRIRCSRKKITPGLHLAPGPSHPTPWPQHHSQLLVVLVREVAEPGRVEEELGRVLQQEQDEAQAAQAAETQASLTVPVRHPSPWGPASARFSSASSLPPHRAWPFTCSVWARCPDPLPPWTWLTSQHPSLCIHHLAQGGATEKVLTASS